MNWELCWLCQKDKTEEALPKRKDLKDIIVINANDFPRIINSTVSQFNDGSEVIVVVFVSNGREGSSEYSQKIPVIWGSSPSGQYQVLHYL